MGLIIENKISIEKSDFISVAKRQNNKKRTFLIVNKIQAKHIPADPYLSLWYFKQLGQLVAQSCKKDERVLVIGFCETATAIGAAIAHEIPNSTYCHTTREDMGIAPTVSFLEEHSHAVDQNLYLHGNIDEFDRIVFADDEITTGKTILNFINALEDISYISNIKFTVAGLIFGENSEELLKNSVDNFCYLNRITTPKVTDGIGKAPSIGFGFSKNLIPEIIVNRLVNPRVEISSSWYHDACVVFAKETIGKIGDFGNEILILGTEEFMYPALILAKEVSKMSKKVFCHSTSRSPIMPSEAEDYPINSQYRLQSFYDPERTTYVYNLRKYDEVIIATDSEPNHFALSQLAGALEHCGNTKITLVRWTD